MNTTNQLSAARPLLPSYHSGSCVEFGFSSQATSSKSRTILEGVENGGVKTGDWRVWEGVGAYLALQEPLGEMCSLHLGVYGVK